ncbi:MAG: hypothetical protein BYD32DRAFT_419413 [Podila humilis]|nr:MAG: hypothetical protein BYD32DRAFT_419413 [Podila humilis]
MTRKSSRFTKTTPAARSLRSSHSGRYSSAPLLQLATRSTRKHHTPRHHPTTPTSPLPTPTQRSPTPPQHSPTPPQHPPTLSQHSFTPTQRSLSPTPFEDTKTNSRGPPNDTLSLPRPARRTPASVQYDLPSAISIRINFRIGQPQTHTRIRQSLPAPDLWEYKWDEHSQDILCLRIQRRIATIPGVEWPAHSVPWLQPKHNAAFLQFLPLDEGSCDFKLKQAWHREAKRLGGSSGVVLNLFVYLSETKRTRGEGAGSGSRGRPAHTVGARTDTIRRATQGGTVEARERISREVENGHMDRLGNIRMAHSAVHLARRAPHPESERLEIPSTNTYRQMEHLDRRAEVLRQEADMARTTRQAEYFTVEMKMGPNVFQVEVKVEDVRKMLGLP